LGHKNEGGQPPPFASDKKKRVKMVKSRRRTVEPGGIAAHREKVVGVDKKKNRR